MIKKVTIRDPTLIRTIIDAIHDRWFDRDEIVFDRERLILSFRFRSEVPEGKWVNKSSWIAKKLPVPFVEGFLRIFHVKGYSITDKERVGIYDFNEVTYDAELKRISITTGVPIGLEIDVEAFEVSVELSDDVLVMKETRLLN